MHIIPVEKNTISKYNGNMPSTFLFYDLETFGLDSKADRIAQAACIRTDMNLKVIKDPLVMLCRIAPDYLPSPSSCLVTGITPQQTLKEGIGEYDFITKLNREFSVPGTIVTGFNNIAFDDEFIRNTLYRNLMDPYEREWQNGCSRWDILDLVRAVHDFRPEGMNFLHKNEKGRTSFKLVHLTQDNNIPQEGAHDALVDVYATINVAKLIKTLQPQLFSFYFSNRTKSRVNAMLDTMHSTPVMYTCQAFSSERGSSRPVCPLTFETSRSSTVICFDLTENAEALLEGDDILRTKGLVYISTNRCPYIAPIGILTGVKEVQERLMIDLELMHRNVKFIRQNKAEILRRFVSAPQKSESVNSSLDPDLRIYSDSFYSENDRINMKMVNAYPPEKKLKTVWHFDSDKISKLLFRQVARNWPEVLSENEKILWKNYCATRLLQPFNRNPDYNTYMNEITEKLNSIGTSAKDKLTLVALREYGQSLYSSLMG